MKRRSCLSWPSGLLLAPLAITAALAVSAPGVGAAQDGEAPGEARGSYAWGEEGGGTTGAAAGPEDPIRIVAYAGAGAGFRLVRNLDPPFQQDFLVPAFLDLGAAVFLPGREIRHGVAFHMSTTLMTGENGGVPAGQQWALTPSYAILLPFQRLLGMEQDMLQLQGRVGVPLVLGSALGSSDGGVDFTFGLELGVAIHIKFLAGFGVYVEAQADIYGGSSDTVHPTITFDAGLVLDYEVLP